MIGAARDVFRHGSIEGTTGSSYPDAAIDIPPPFAIGIGIGIGIGMPSRMLLYLFSLRSYVLDSRGGAESAEKTPEINLRVSASPRGNEAFKPPRV